MQVNSITTGHNKPRGGANDCDNRVIHDSPLEQLQQHLMDKYILLILDNFEHLLPASQLMSILVNSAPALHLIVTSREALNVSNESLYALRGLGYPSETSESDAKHEDYDAVKLFNKRALQVRHDFSLEQHIDSVIRICELVQGMPLAIELAASWLNMLSCEEIADEIQNNLDFLESPLRDIPERHRSIRAVFNQSWKRLTENEKAILKRLAVFKGGFTLDAAKNVASASLPVLSALLNQALLQRSENGRYSLHELLRQYAEEKLSEDIDNASAIYDAHAAYFTAYLLTYDERQLNTNSSASGSENMAFTYAELDNILYAFERIMEHAEPLDAQTALRAVSNMFQTRARYVDARNLFQRTVEHLRVICQQQEDRLPVLSQALTVQGWASIRLSLLDEARDVLLEAEEIVNQLADSSSLYLGQSANRSSGLSMVFYVLGEYEDSINYARLALEQSVKTGRQVSIATAYRDMGRGLSAIGDYEDAYRYLLKYKDMTETNEGFWFRRYRAYCLLELGRLSFILENQVASSAYFAEALTIEDIQRDDEWRALFTKFQGQIAYQNDDFTYASTYFNESLHYYQLFGDRHNVTLVSAKLGMTYIELGDFNQAKHWILYGLGIAMDMAFVPGLLLALTAIADLLITVKMNLDLAKYLLNLVVPHPNMDHETRELAKSIQQRAQNLLQTISYDEAFSTNDLMMLSTLVRNVLVDKTLTLTSTIPHDLPIATAEMQVVANDALIEPLTERELEVLNLLADGMTNQEIATRLFLATGTVKAHNHNIFSKLGVTNRVKAIASAKDLGLLKR